MSVLYYTSRRHKKTLNFSRINEVGHVDQGNELTSVPGFVHHGGSWHGTKESQ